MTHNEHFIYNVRCESRIIILYSASEQGYLVLALYKHALLLCTPIAMLTKYNQKHLSHSLSLSNIPKLAVLIVAYLIYHNIFNQCQVYLYQ